MAAQATLIKQVNYVTTIDMKVFVLALSDLIRDSQGEVSRHAIQRTFGFTDESEVPGGTTLEKMLLEGFKAMTGDDRMPAEVIKTALRKAQAKVKESAQ